VQLADTQPPQIELSQGDGKVRLTLGTIRPGSWRGISFHVTGRLPAVTIEAAANGGQPLALQSLTGDISKPRLTLDFAHAQTESGFAVPDQGVVFRLVSFDHLPTDPARGPALLVQAFAVGQSEPVSSQFIIADTSIEVGGARYTLELTQSLLVTATHDPGFFWALTGIGLAWVGYVLGLLKPYRAWLVTLISTSAGTQVRRCTVEVGSGLDTAPSLSAVSTWLAASAPALALAALAVLTWWGQWKLGHYWGEHIIQKVWLAVMLAVLAWHTWTKRR
jgi:hypothetical protein